MKTIISAVILATFLIGTANADQKKHSKGHNIDQIVSSLQLDLTKAESLKILIKSHREKKRALREQGKKDREQKQALRKQHRKALLDLLGYEKMYEFEEVMRQSRPKRRKHNHG